VNPDEVSNIQRDEVTDTMETEQVLQRQESRRHSSTSTASSTSGVNNVFGQSLSPSEDDDDRHDGVNTMRRHSRWPSRLRSGTGSISSSGNEDEDEEELELDVVANHASNGFRRSVRQRRDAGQTGASARIGMQMPTMPHQRTETPRQRVFDDQRRGFVQIAVESDRVELLTLLLRRGANVMWRDVNGRTAFYSAVRLGNVSMLRSLLNYLGPRMPKAELEDVFALSLTDCEDDIRTKRHKCAALLIDHGATGENIATGLWARIDQLPGSRRLLMIASSNTTLEQRCLAMRWELLRATCRDTQESFSLSSGLPIDVLNRCISYLAI